MIDDLPHTTRAAREFGMFAVLFGAPGTRRRCRRGLPGLVHTAGRAGGHAGMSALLVIVLILSWSSWWETR